MGTFSVDFVIWSRGRTQHRTLNGVVDTGASFTVVPEAILDELGIERRRTGHSSWPMGPDGKCPSSW